MEPGKPTKNSKMQAGSKERTVMCSARVAESSLAKYGQKQACQHCGPIFLCRLHVLFHMRRACVCSGPSCLINIPTVL